MCAGRRFLLALASVVVLAVAAPAAAAPGISVEIGHKASLEGSGQSVVVSVEVTCSDLPGPVLEAFIQVNQRKQSIFGEGGFPPLNCDGAAHVYDVRAFSLDQPFRPGIANASAFILACDETGANCEQGQASARIVVN
jgi:hypothetical protein